MSPLVWPSSVNVTCEFAPDPPRVLDPKFCGQILFLRDYYGGCFAAYNTDNYHSFAAQFLHYCYGCREIA